MRDGPSPSRRTGGLPGSACPSPPDPKAYAGRAQPVPRRQNHLPCCGRRRRTTFQTKESAMTSARMAALVAVATVFLCGRAQAQGVLAPSGADAIAAPDGQEWGTSGDTLLTL